MATNIATTPAPTAPQPIETPAELPVGDGWSAPALRALGVPDEIVRATLTARPTDDDAWADALADAVDSFCGELPDGPTLIAGPQAEALAAALGIPVIIAGEEAPEHPVVALATEDVEELLASRHGRHIHLLVGGAWQELARVRPVAVSAAGQRYVLAALTVAAGWTVPLGWVGGFTAKRITPDDVVIDVEALLGLDLD
jgi:hypothetical protein